MASDLVFKSVQLEMDRYKRQIRLRCDSGLPIKRDTPVKPALTRRDRKKNTVIHILTQSTLKR